MKFLLAIGGTVAELAYFVQTLLVDGDLAAYLQSEGRSGYTDLNGDGDAVDDMIILQR